MKVRVEVTNEDLKHGWDWSYTRLHKKYGKNFHRVENKRCEHCPVAVALARTFGQKAIAETYRLHIGGVVHRCPEGVSDWMYDFDKGFDVKPFSFDLEIGNDQENTPEPPPGDGGGDARVAVAGDTKPA